MKNKTLILIAAIKMMFVLFFTSCDVGRLEGENEESRGTFTIRNNTFSTIYNVMWNGVMFGTIAPGTSVQKNVLPIAIFEFRTAKLVGSSRRTVADGASDVPSGTAGKVDSGTGFIFFRRAIDPINARTFDYITVMPGMHNEFIFINYTIIEDLSPVNIGNLGRFDQIGR